MLGREGLPGTVLKAVGGFYTVDVPGRGLLTCRARGRLRHAEQGVLPGDRVEVRILGARDGVIEAVQPRRTELSRPPVANLERCVAVQSLAEPPPNLQLLDRVLVLAECAGLKAAVCWNKVDLADRAAGERMAAPYRAAGYPVFLTSARTGEGLAELRAFLAGHISTLAGPSGVGKSTLLNALVPGLRLATGAVSPKLGRGRHTTRHVELLALQEGGWVADTPGFSVLDLSRVPREELAGAFPELFARSGGCRFPGCTHRREPECAVRRDVEEGRLDPGRYQRYLALLVELEACEQRRYD